MEKQTNIAPINEDLNVAVYDVEEIKQKIFTIRGKQVILDSDVAKMYHYETKYINLTVRRNKDRFPERFCFQLTKDEVKNSRGKNIKYLPYVFTEQGIAMLSGLLKNEIAVQVSINIMDSFV